MYQSNTDYFSKEQLASHWYLNVLRWSLIPIFPYTKKPPFGFKWGYYQHFQPRQQEVDTWLRNGWWLAVVTGPISNLVIVDDDRVKNGLPEWGFTSNIISASEHLGKHYYHLYDRELHQGSNKKLHIDIRAWHNYCLLPPFGNRYWISKPTRENLAKLTPVPDEIVNLINSNKKPKLTIPTPPKVFIPQTRPISIKGETWIERVKRAKQAPFEAYVLPFLHQQSNIYGGLLSLCPFHKEHTPSFELKFPTSDQMDFHGHCYGCNTHVIGVIAFHMARTGLNFKEAVRDLTS